MATLIEKAIADQIVARGTHGNGRFVRWEDRGGKVVAISKCSNPNCGAERAVTLTNATQAVQNPTIPVIVCSMGCKTIIAAPKKETLEDVLAIPEYKRSSAQQRIVAEAEIAQIRAAERYEKEAPTRAVQARQSVADNQELFIQHERLLQAIVILVHGTMWNGSNEDAAVREHPAYISLSNWKQLSNEERTYINDIADRQLSSAGQSDYMRV